MLSIPDQIKNQIESTESVLILTKKNAPDDTIAASWGLSHLLKNLGKNPTVLESENGNGKMSFLSQPEHMIKEIKSARDFVLSFNTARNKITDFRTENKIDSFDIYITPEKATIDPRDFSLYRPSSSMIWSFCLDARISKVLERLRTKTATFFLKSRSLISMLPAPMKIRPDKLGGYDRLLHRRYFVGTGQVVLGKQTDAESAQCFLAGLVSATSNFQSPHTNPQTFMTASWLIEKGADQQKIIRELFKTQSFPFMKLWGRVMARLNWNEDLKLAWSMVSIEDFVKSRTKPDQLPLILGKIKDNFSAGKLFVILYSETLDQSIALIKNGESESLQKIQKVCGGEIQNGYLKIVFEKKNILEAEKELLEKIKSA